MKRTLCTLALLGASCINDYPQNTPLETITGIPLSTGESYARDLGTFAVVIEQEGKHILARSGLSGNSEQQYGTGTIQKATAQALVESEMNDGDDEPIELTGHYQDDRFIISSLKANGYTVNFD